MGRSFGDTNQRFWDYAIERRQASSKWLRTRPKKVKVLLIGLLVLLFAGTMAFAITANRLSARTSHPRTDFPDSILTENDTWPNNVKVGGVANVDGYAVVYSADGYFAVYRDGVLHHILYADGRQSGIYQRRIFTEYSDSVYFYDAEGRLEKKTFPSVLNQQMIIHKDQVSISPYVYRVIHERGLDRVIVEKDGHMTELIVCRYINPVGFVIAAIVCFLLFGVAFFTIFLFKALPDIRDVMRKYGKIN